MRNTLLLLGVIVAIVMAIASVAWSMCTRLPSVSVWTSHALYGGLTLRLNSDGTYVILPGGDIVPHKPERGHWYQRGNRYALIPTETARRIRILQSKSILGCEFLLTEKVTHVPGSIFPNGVTQLDLAADNTDCHERAEADNRAHQVAP